VLDQFTSSRGIRQGNPISPYLIILSLERLFHWINVVVYHKLWKPIKLVQGGPYLSHFAFEGDLLILAEASMDQVAIIKHDLR